LDELGEAKITIQAEANGKTIETFFIITVDPATGIEDFEKENICIYPNPCKDYFWLDMGNYNGEVEVSILNLTGCTVKQKQIRNSSRERFDMTGLPTGMYLIRIYTSERNFVKKIMKE
jgi:hypothetical protein